MDREAETKMIQARVHLINYHPFFGDLALSMPAHERSNMGMPTMMTDGRAIFYDPGFAKSETRDTLEFVIAHEVMHKILQHIGRGDGRQPKRWNHAIDYAANWQLVESGFKMPPHGLYDAAYANMTAEEIYNKLPENPPGEALDGHSTRPPTPDEQERFDRDLIRAVAAYGDAPGFVKRYVEQVTAPVNNWRDRMSRFMSEVARDDYSFARLNRKALASGYYLPGMYSEALGGITVAIDTSGSITQEVLNAFGGHLNELRTQTRPISTQIIYCDAAVNHVEEVDQYTELHLEAYGGGGTDFCPPFEHVERHGGQPKCFLYLTDGYGRFPSQPPPYPVLWLMTTDVKPPWGEVVRIEA